MGLLKTRPARQALALALPLCLLAMTACTESASLHEDPVAKVAIGLVVILIAAKLGGEIATRLGQPAVLGELVMGVILGNLGLIPGLDGIGGSLHQMAENSSIKLLAGLGVLLLLFEVGLESTVGQM